MGCPDTAILDGEPLIFSVCVHDPDTAALTDATPSYRIYEATTGTPVATGTMSKLDDANTVGFYATSLTCSTANGYEAGKTYTILVTASVGGVDGGISYGFTVQENPALASELAKVTSILELVP
jgi:hypothetical protein